MTVRRLARSFVVIGSLAGIIVFLHWAGRFELTGPREWSGDGLRRWIEDPIVVVATATRWLALALAYYLVAVLLLLAGSSGSTRFSRLIPLRWVAPLSAAVGLTAVVAPMALHDANPDVGGSAPLRLDAATPALVLERVAEPSPDRPVADTVPRGRLDYEGFDDPVTPPVSTPAPVIPEYFVQPGESMWSIACDSLIEAWGRPATDAEIVPYWRDLIEANRDRLVESGNPDLILPGQQFVLPAPPADPRGR